MVSKVHRELGPGLLESTYAQCPAHELKLNGIVFQLQRPPAVQYKGIRLDCGYQLDLLVEGERIVELKSVEKLRGIAWSAFLAITFRYGCHMSLQTQGGHESRVSGSTKEAPCQCAPDVENVTGMPMC